MVKITLFLIISLALLQPSALLGAAAPATTEADAAGGNPFARHASNNRVAMGEGSSKMVTCPEPRPEVCTQDYQPVCAQLEDGSFKTYSNGCNACSDPAVVGYRDGACQ